MLNNLLPYEIKTALKLSFEFWILGVVCFIQFMFFGFDLLTGIKLFLLIDPFIILFLSIIYLRRANSNNSIKEGGLFGSFLVMTYLHADILFMLLFFKEGLIIFKAYLGVLFYGEMILFSAMAGLFVNAGNKKKPPSL